jgi:hypothetical protein
MRIRIIGLLLVISILSMMLPLAGCSKEAAPAASTAPKEIRVGILGGITSPSTSSSIMKNVQDFEAYFKYINEVEGGLDGAKITWQVGDTKGTPDGAITAYKELRDGFKPFLYFAIEDYCSPVSKI